jgi:hypothetical protein
MGDLEKNATQLRTGDAPSDLYPLKFQIHVPHTGSASTRPIDEHGSPAETTAVSTFNDLAALLTSTGRENWAPILISAATQCSPDLACREDTTVAAICLLTAVLASVDTKGHDQKARRTAQVLRRFSWLNRMNLLRYQHELTTMESDFRQNLSSLLDSQALDKMRNTLKDYSTSSGVN